MLVRRTSQISGKVHEMELSITHEQVIDFQCGALVQDAFPNLTPAEREFILTGITPEEWDDVFGNDDDEEEGDE